MAVKPANLSPLSNPLPLKIYLFMVRMSSDPAGSQLSLRESQGEAVEREGDQVAELSTSPSPST